MEVKIFQDLSILVRFVVQMPGKGKVSLLILVKPSSLSFQMPDILSVHFCKSADTPQFFQSFTINR